MGTFYTVPFLAPRKVRIKREALLQLGAFEALLSREKKIIAVYGSGNIFEHGLWGILNSILDIQGRSSAG